MSIEDNKDTVRRWFTEIVGGSIPAATAMSLALRLISPDLFTQHGGEPSLLALLPELQGALSGLRFTIEQIIGEENLIAVRVRGEAIHVGEVLGIAPSGRRVTWVEHEFFRLDNGLIVESWGEGSLDRALMEARDRRGRPGEEESHSE